jgi:hypothetical protein
MNSKASEVYFFFLIFLMPFSGVGFSLLLIDPFRHLVGLLGRGISPAPRPVVWCLHTGQHNTEKRRHISMPRAGFGPAIPMFERPKTVLALDRATIEIGSEVYKISKHVHYRLEFSFSLLCYLLH